MRKATPTAVLRGHRGDLSSERRRTDDGVSGEPAQRLEPKGAADGRRWLDGTLQTGLGRFTSQPNGTQNALARRYATLGGDGGHKGSVFDGTFALNDEALMNYGQLSVKKVHDVAVAIIEKRYGARPSRFYFIGLARWP